MRLPPARCNSTMRSAPSPQATIDAIAIAVKHGSGNCRFMCRVVAHVAHCAFQMRTARRPIRFRPPATDRTRAPCAPARSAARASRAWPRPCRACARRSRRCPLARSRRRLAAQHTPQPVARAPAAPSVARRSCRLPPVSPAGSVRRLQQHRPGIQTGFHLHQADAGLGVAGEHGTLDRRRTAPARQQRGMHVPATQPRHASTVRGRIRP